VRVLADDYSTLQVGAFPHDYTPLGEYHFRIPSGSQGGWIESTLHYSWRGDSSWNIVLDDGNRVLEQSNVRQVGMPMMVTGSHEWKDVVIKTSFRPLTDHGCMGILFRYCTSRHYYACWYGHGKLQIVAQDDEEQTVLAEADSRLSCDAYHDVTISVSNSRLLVSVNETQLVAESSLYQNGLVGFAANAPVRFGPIEVYMEDKQHEQLRQQFVSKERVLTEKRAGLPRPKLWRKISTPGYGAGKSIRFGDLNGDGQKELVLAQNMRRMGDNFSEISCMTALNLNGDVLWQIGEPSRDHALVTNDLPFQIHDIDGDGAQEVIYCKDFHIKVIDGLTGRLKYQAQTPVAPRYSGKRLKEDHYYRIVGDSIYFCDLRGTGADRDILLKDRYNNLWAYTWDLEELWHFSGNVGHYPMAYDVDGDGKDEILVGYTLLDDDGTKLWSLDLGDHADGVAIGRFCYGEPIQAIIAASDEGILWVSMEGQILRHHRAGHCQTVTVADLHSGRNDPVVATITFWGHPGIVLLYDSSGSLLERRELTAPRGSALSPVNWDGSGRELILLSGHPVHGGMIDGECDTVVRFPDDGHPYLCCEPVDLVGDKRDEIILWDEDSIWIYTQEDDGSDSCYSPIRQREYNMSNYRAQISLNRRW
jgi:rhamnogalacturonan endolyase